MNRKATSKRLKLEKQMDEQMKWDFFKSKKVQYSFLKVT